MLREKYEKRIMLKIEIDVLDRGRVRVGRWVGLGGGTIVSGMGWRWDGGCGIFGKSRAYELYIHLQSMISVPDESLCGC